MSEVKTLIKKYLPEGIAVGEKELDDFGYIASRLSEENEKFNLTSLKTDEEVALLHFIDSLSVLEFVDMRDKTVADIGTGGGFPAFPIAVASGAKNVTAVDSTAKKLSFIENTAKELGISNISTLCGRAEDLARTDKRESFDIVVSRGVARMNILLEWCLPLVKVGGLFVAMKGERAAEEADEAKNAAFLLGGKKLSINKVEIPLFGYVHNIVIYKKVTGTAEKYPRSNGNIKKKPL